MSIRFSDLQVLLPRASSTSQIEGHSQKQAVTAQAQLAAESVAETEAKRRQAERAQATAKQGIEKGRGRSQPQMASSAEANEEQGIGNDLTDGPIDGGNGLGESIDIRI